MDIDALANRLLRDQLDCTEVDAVGDALTGTTGITKYVVSRSGLERYLGSVTSEDADALSPGLAKDEAGVRLLGIELSTLAHEGTGAMLGSDGSVASLGGRSSTPPVADIHQVEWSESPGPS